MNILQPIIRQVFTPFMKDVNAFIKHPHEVQDKIFHYLIENGKDTFYGQKYNFGSIKSYSDFQKSVPLIRYEELRPYLDKIIINKQTNVLWNKPVKWFSMSSGTTKDKSKYIPVTHESLKDSHYKCGKQMLAMYMNSYPKSDFLLGKTLVLGGSQQINNIGSGIYTGDISAILMKYLPFWAKTRRTPEKIALIPDWEKKFDKLIDYSLKTDIRAITGVPSWILVLLQQLTERSGKTLHEIWPNMDVFFHGGINFTPYENQYNSLFAGSNIHYWETYNASEGFFAIQYSKESRNMLLMLDNNILYEFIPLSELDSDNPQTVFLKDVEVGKNYALVISTNGGLWRYIIGDTIEFTSTDPYLIKITGRTKAFINAFGEELIVENADNALKKAAEKTQSVFTEYTAAPLLYQDKAGGKHEWLIEFSSPPADIDTFASILDEELKKQNSDYEAKRSYNLSLQKPFVQALPPGTFYEWMKSRNKLGGQNKIPRLSNDRDHVESIRRFLQKKGL